MIDQALKLRQLAKDNLHQEKPTGPLRVITVCSGKGGVGKTNLVINLAISLAKMGKKVIVFDADLGLANIDVLLGIVPKYTLYDVFQGEKTLDEIILEGPENLHFIPGGSGIQELANLDYYQRERLIQGLRSFENSADFLLIDTGAGISKNVLGFVTAADEVIVVLTPEPTSITDAYGIIKILSQFKLHSEVNVVINRATSLHEAQFTAEKIAMVAKKFLQIKVKQLGHIFDDDIVSKAVKKQQPFCLAYPNSPPAINIREISQKLLGDKSSEPKGVASFINKLIRLFG